jgi:hypothetical protein
MITIQKYTNILNHRRQTVKPLRLNPGEPLIGPIKGQADYYLLDVPEQK